MHLEHLDLANLSNLEHLNLTNLSDLEHLDLTGLSALRELRFFHKFGGSINGNTLIQNNM